MTAAAAAAAGEIVVVVVAAAGKKSRGWALLRAWAEVEAQEAAGSRFPGNPGLTM